MATYSRSNAALPLPLTEWNEETGWAGAVLGGGGTTVTIANTDGTFTRFVGTAFALDGSGNATAGTVTSIVRLSTDGVTVLETVAGLSLALVTAQTQVAASTLISTALSGGETIAGGSENDFLLGYAGTDTVTGGAGVANVFGGRGDVVVGGAGNDTINLAADGSTIVNYAVDGGAGGVSGTLTNAGGTLTDTFGNTDTLSAGPFQLILTDVADSVTTGSGDDFLAPGGGVDIINMGSGSDELSYGFAAGSNSYSGQNGFVSGITVNITGYTSAGALGNVVDPTGSTDTFAGVDSFRGTQLADTFNGGSGNDTFRGHGGNDIFNGSSGSDTVRYDREIRSGGLTGVTVNLSTATATDTFGSTDTLNSIENIYATKFDDVLFGNGFDNDFRPFEGNDTIDGGGGLDGLFYGNGLGAGGNPTGTVGIAVTMGGTAGAGTVTSAIFGTDTFSSIERIFGTQLNDTFTGGAFDDDFAPDLGTDTIAGGEGFDVLRYYITRLNNTGPAGITVTLTGQGNGTAVKNSFGGATDTFTGIDLIIGTLQNDVFNGGAGNDQFDGAQGTDTFTGGGGVDTVRYNFDAGISVGAIVNLTTGTATDGYGYTDSLSEIENVYGTNRSNLSDSITGDGNNNTFRGFAGDDTLDGAGGSDTVEYIGDFSRGGTAAAGVYLSSNIAVDGFGNFDTLLSIENVIGTDVNTAAYNDIVLGSVADNYIELLGGGDIAVADSGNDVVYGGGGTDAIYGGEGNDILIGSNFSLSFNGEIDYLLGDGGNDTLYCGTAGFAYIDGGTGNDTIFGGSSGDYVLSGGGSDTVTLSGGIDLVILYATELASGEADVYADFTDGQDFIYANASLAGLASFGDGAGFAYMAISVGGGTHFTIFNGVTSAQITDQIFFNL